jgi:ParB/RepB/Spo0J family partition protein
MEKAGMISIDKIEPNKWNPNVMGPIEYEALKQDMHVHGARGIDPILVSPYKAYYQITEVKVTDKFIIVDGEHRWKAAGELHWKEVYCTIGDITEEDAKALCYRRNRERGNIDPFKEALLFKSDLDQNMTQAKVAGKYGVEQGTVSHRLSLLKLDPTIIEKVQSMPRGIITPSHLEPIATLELKDQKILGESLLRESKREGAPFWSVRDIGFQVERIKKERAEEKALEKALETSEYPKCPECKKKPTRINYQGLPWVRCEGFHTSWNLETGKREYEPESHTEKTLTGETRKVPSTVIRSVHTVKELHDIFTERIREFVPKLKISGINVRGKFEDQEFSVELGGYENSMSVSWHLGNTWEGFHAEAHDYRSGEKTCIHAHSPERIPTAKELMENAFIGKLGIEPKEKQKKTSEEVIHGLHSGEPLEAENIITTENPKESLSNEK